MSITVDQSYIEQFSANVHMLAEQQMSRLRRTVFIESVTGESFARERLGGIDAPNEISNLHGDTPLNNTPHSRRWGFIKDFDVADMIDNQSQVRLLIDPASRYTMRHASTMGRGMDDSIVTALSGDVKQGKNAGTTVSLPAAQKIAHGSTGLTIAKLIQAKEKFDSSDVDTMMPRFLATSPRGVRDLLEDDKITSADYNTVKALVNGEVNEFMGFQFIMSNRLPAGNIGANIRQSYAFVQGSVILGVAQEPTTIAAPRPDKRHSLQIYTYGSWGGMRIEDELVVEIAHDES